jgi:hypothetical protein
MYNGHVILANSSGSSTTTSTPKGVNGGAMMDGANDEFQGIRKAKYAGAEENLIDLS